VTSSEARSTLALPTMSVAIPTRGRLDRIVPLVERMLAEPGVVDVAVATGLGDESIPQLEDVRSRDDRLKLVVLDPPPSAAVARLAATKQTTGEIVVVLDDDIWPEAGFVEGHARYHVEGANLVVNGTMPVRLSPRREPGQAAIRIYADEWEQSWKDNHDDPLRALWMGHLSVRRESLIEVEDTIHGTWDDAYHEDTDLGFRLADSGLIGVAADDLRAEHLQDRRLPEVIRDAERQVRGIERLAERYPGRQQILPQHVVDPALLFRASRVLNYRFVGPLTIRVGAAVEYLAGRLHLWRLETAVVRLLRRLVAMSALQRLNADRAKPADLVLDGDVRAV
jgi:glycosyltransferase involved in cell wall biosynthesis